MTPQDYLRLMLDPVRIAVLGRGTVGPVDTAEIARELGLPTKKVQEAVGSLRGAGLLDDDLRLNRQALRAVAESLPQFEPAEVPEGPWTPEEVQTLGRFFEGSRLREIPSQAAKRRVVLERLVQEFEPGVRYPEREVNLALQLFHDDYAALRRYLVDDGLMTRADGVYWRSGGRV
ncbi:MAG: DUF2087 domain-containing protein [Acidimicrobiia bacterium]|nr:DUF2087 domain-containing protein [Acidimicrobiia bacterium]